ncbi:hypothetical protein [Paracoccus yeei]|uniref:hypothetical protein n=1 Tax=Paracoccus yeei TaxID=147645 RepID=UPI00143000C9|nr:hypothetical protein [Paracoccus yeei]
MTERLAVSDGMLAACAAALTALVREGAIRRDHILIVTFPWPAAGELPEHIRPSHAICRTPNVTCPASVSSELLAKPWTVFRPT